MFEIIKDALKNDGQYIDSLKQGKQFNYMQNFVINKDKSIFEGMETRQQNEILQELNDNEMNNITTQIDGESNYNKVLSDCAAAVKLYNEELAKGRPDYNTAEDLRNSMIQTCALNNPSIQQFRDHIANLETNNNQLDSTKMNNTSPTLEEKLMRLDMMNIQLNDMQGKSASLDGEIEDNELDLNSVYIRYFTWMFASVTMTSIVVHQLLKN